LHGRKYPLKDGGFIFLPQRSAGGQPSTVLR
jgi:hypothetical protein